MIPSVLDLLFGCTHRNRSFPITPNRNRRRPAAALVTGTYVVCLDCGKEFPYDWGEMKTLAQPAARSGRARDVEASPAKAA